MIPFDTLVGAATTIGFPAAIALYFIWFVLTQMSRKQDKLIENQEKQTEVLQNILNTMNSTREEVQEIQDRIETVEKTLGIEHRSRRRRKEPMVSTVTAIVP